MRTGDDLIEKIIEAMEDYILLHTYEDDGNGYPLVDALTPDGKTIDVGKAECGELAAELYDLVIAPHILEAERRAEQRVRAEIARDSERLDWLEQQFILMALVKGPAPVALDKKLDAVFTQTGGVPFRKAIDAAREVG